MGESQLIAKEDEVDFYFGDDVVESYLEGRFPLALLVVPTLIVKLPLEVVIMVKIINVFTLPITPDILHIILTLLFLHQIMDDHLQPAIVFNYFGVVEDAEVFPVYLLGIN